MHAQHVINFILLRVGVATLVLLGFALAKNLIALAFEASDLGANDYVSQGYHLRIRPRVDE
jgi:hypothetical protein